MLDSTKFLFPFVTVCVCGPLTTEVHSDIYPVFYFIFFPICSHFRKNKNIFDFSPQEVLFISLIPFLHAFFV